MKLLVLSLLCLCLIPVPACADDDRAYTKSQFLYEMRAIKREQRREVRALQDLADDLSADVDAYQGSLYPSKKLPPVIPPTQPGLQALRCKNGGYCPTQHQD